MEDRGGVVLGRGQSWGGKTGLWKNLIAGCLEHSLVGAAMCLECGPTEISYEPYT